MFLYVKTVFPKFPFLEVSSILNLQYKIKKRRLKNG